MVEPSGPTPRRTTPISFRSDAGRDYAYRCAWCLGVMVFGEHGASFCPTCNTLSGGFYLPVAGTPAPLPPDLPKVLKVPARHGWRWRWPLGDLLEWDWLLSRA